MINLFACMMSLFLVLTVDRSMGLACYLCYGCSEDSIDTIINCPSNNKFCKIQTTVIGSSIKTSKSCAASCVAQNIGSPNIGYQITRCCEVDLCNVVVESATSSTSKTDAAAALLSRAKLSTPINAANNSSFSSKTVNLVGSFQILSLVCILNTNIFFR